MSRASGRGNTARRIIVVTGTDTGVGKTALTALLAAQLCERGHAVVALKPVCSGSRADARALRAAAGHTLRLDEINPWHFPAPLAPLLAARRQGECVGLGNVVRHIESIQRRFEITLVEGAGGLLSPLGEDFSTRELIVALRARVIVTCADRLGAVNQTLLVLAALPRAAAACAQIVLMPVRHADAVRRVNRLLLAELLGAGRVHSFPRLSCANPLRPSLYRPVLSRVLNCLIACLD